MFRLASASKVYPILPGSRRLPHAFFGAGRASVSNTAEYLKSLRIKTHRLERIISNRGLGSRTEVSMFLRQGRIKINGAVVRSGSARYGENIDILFDDQPVICVPQICLYNKPVGVHCTMVEDRTDRSTLTALFKTFPYLKLMHPVGRLDADTSGLLLFSRNGKLTNLLLDPKTGVKREYEAIVAGVVDRDTLRAELKDGIKTADGTHCADLLEARVLVEEDLSLVQIANVFPRSAQPLGESSGKQSGMQNIMQPHVASPSQTSFVRLRVSEGKHRMVRRILHNAGHSVIKLHRNMYGRIVIGDLPEGQVRPASESDEAWAISVSAVQLRKNAQKQEE